jgi:hypothetical protein
MQDDFKKINIDIEKNIQGSVNNPKNEILKAHKNKNSMKIWKRLFFVIFICLLIISIPLIWLIYTLMPLRGILAKVEVAASSGKELAASFKDQDLAKAKESLNKTKSDFDNIKLEYAKVEKLSNLPFIGNYINDGKHIIKAGDAGLEAISIAIGALEPNADLLGFKGGSKFVSGSADQRIQLAVKTMKALIPDISKMAKSINTVRTEIDMVNPDRYPESIRGIKIKSRLLDAKQMIDNAAGLFVNAQPLLTSLPSILGEPVEKRYMILFQNDKELRPTGGFITAYAQFRFVGGKMILEKSDDIYALDAAKSKEFPAPREILTFHKGVYNLQLRDSNLSPDFKVSMENFERLYDSVKGKEKIDGIIALDTHVLVEVLKILGPEYIAGREFSSENDKRCDCPKAVYELEDYSSRPVGYVRTDRKGIIGDLLKQIMQKALGVSPSKYWGNLFQMLLSEINQKHVLAYFKDGDAQKGAESFNMAGRIMTATDKSALLKFQEGQNWDYLHINNSNMAGAKSNMFVSEEVIKDVTVNSDSSVNTKLTIQYKNPYPGSDCNLERGGLCLNAPLRNWLRVYVPKGSTLIDSKGTQSPKDQKAEAMQTYEDLGKTVFEGFLVINPLGNSKVELTYKTPYFAQDGKYKLLIQKQPGTDKQQYTVKVNNKKQEQGILISDQEYDL